MHDTLTTPLPGSCFEGGSDFVVEAVRTAATT